MSTGMAPDANSSDLTAWSGRRDDSSRAMREPEDGSGLLPDRTGKSPFPWRRRKGDLPFMTEIEATTLPENAYVPLKPGETYHPIVPAEARQPELTWRSIFWGIAFCAIFSVASAY